MKIEQTPADQLDAMLRRAHDLIINYVREGQRPGSAVVKRLEPNDLLNLLDLKLSEQGASEDETFNLIKQTLDYSVNSWNPAFMDKLYASTDPIGVISELLLGVLNGNAHVYHVSPVLTLMEIHVTKATAKLLGMGEKAGGLFCPGGSASNLLAMVTARNRMFPSIKKSGYFPRPMNPAAEYGKLKVFTSTHSHYSIDKAAMVLGLGSENIVKVPADAHGRMLVPELERLLSESKERGETPFFINATAGTTVMGAFDPIADIAAVAKKFGCWLHVDGSWGGSAIFSSKVRDELGLLDGSALADTFTLNPHKLLGVPLQCSMLLTPHGGHKLYAEANTLAADYLFHGNQYDLGAGTIGCGRRPDALKMFLAWKFHGRDGLGGRIDRAMKTSQGFAQLVRSTPNFELVLDDVPFCQVCFWYTPRELEDQVAAWRKQDAQVFKEKMTVVTQRIHSKVLESGEFLVDHAPIENLPVFFRVAINAPCVDLDRDLRRLLDAIVAASNQINWDDLKQH